MGLYRVISLRVGVDLEVIKGYSTFFKALALLKPNHQIVLYDMQDTILRGVLPLCRDAIGVFYSPSRLRNLTAWYKLLISYRNS